MRLSTKVRYSVRFMLELALHYEQGAMSLRDVADRQGVSEKYLEHLVAALKAAGLVRGLRGRHGGYALARPPDEIPLSAIHAALEGSLAPVECVDDPNVCSREGQCVARDVWKEVRDAVQDVLESTTLQHLADRHRRKVGAKAGTMYYI
jgi:Rrf2 family cysteine metabolism transcriptional repressor